MSVMMDDADSDLVPLWFISLVMGGFMVLLTVGGHVLWEDSVRLRAAAQGTGGTPGTFTATELQDSGLGSKRCHGSFRPDGGGPEEYDVSVTMAPPDCVHGRSFRVRLAGSQGVLPGEQDWKASRAATITMWVFIPLTGVPVVLSFQNERRKRRLDEPGEE